MKLHYSPKNNPRVIVIQKIYSKTFNKEEKITFEKHRFKKFIKDVVLGTLERDEVLYEEINKLYNQISYLCNNKTLNLNDSEIIFYKKLQIVIIFIRLKEHR